MYTCRVSNSFLTPYILVGKGGAELWFFNPTKSGILFYFSPKIWDMVEFKIFKMSFCSNEDRGLKTRKKCMKPLPNTTVPSTERMENWPFQQVDSHVYLAGTCFEIGDQPLSCDWTAYQAGHSYRSTHCGFFPSSPHNSTCWFLGHCVQSRL